MAKNTMKALEEFILLINKIKVDVADVLYSFWDDTEDLEGKQTENSILVKANCEEGRKFRKRSQGAERKRLLAELNTLVKERERLRGMVERRRQRVRIAFNQLFLKGQVRKPYYDHGHCQWRSQTFTEMYETGIKLYQDRIESLKKDMANGKDIRLYLMDAEYCLEQLRQTEVLKRSEMGDFLKSVYKPKGELICVGSYLYLHVWPTRIVKENHNQVSQLSLF